MVFFDRKYCSSKDVSDEVGQVISQIAKLISYYTI